MIKLAVVGCGYWGINQVRVFSSLAGCELALVIDKDAEALHRASVMFRDVEVSTSIESVIHRKDIRAVVIATPVWTHYELARRMIQTGKNVLVEKPICQTEIQALSLVKKANENDVTLMVGHTFEYVGAVNHVKSRVSSGQLGPITSVRAVRGSLGLVRSDVGVLHDLAAHDISILNYVLNELPASVVSVGTCRYNPQIADTATTILSYKSGIIATIISSWNEPKKVREITFVGTRKMIVYDDTSTNEKIREYDCGINSKVGEFTTYAEFQNAYRVGDITIPRVQDKEPLVTQAEHFIHSIITKTRPRSDGISGVKVMRVIDSAEKSFLSGGERQAI